MQTLYVFLGRTYNHIRTIVMWEPWEGDMWQEEHGGDSESSQGLDIWQHCCCGCWVASVVSDSVRLHRRQPTRLPHPWDSPGKNTGVGCHFLLQCMKGKSESEDTQSCPTLSDPMDFSPPGSSVQGIFQARGLQWVPLPSLPHRWGFPKVTSLT